MKTKYPPEWRTQTAWKKKFYAHYVRWMERLGYVVVAVVIGAFVFAFNYRVDEVVSADNVQIKAVAYPLFASEQVIVIRTLVDDFSDVQKGEAVLEIVEGQVAVDKLIAWTALTKLGQPPNFAPPQSTLVVAERSGVFVLTPGIVGQPVAKDSELGQIRNYDDLVLTAKLGGDGVPNAKAGGIATIKSITVSSASGILIREEAKGNPIVSGRLVSSETKDELTNLLTGTPLSIRDDLPLKVSTVSKLEVDANLKLQNGQGKGVWGDPAASEKLRAEVISGEHTAVLQFAKLTPELQSQVNLLLSSSLQGKTIVGLDGQTRIVGNPVDFNTVFQVTAVPGIIESEKLSIPSTTISRNFEAKLKIKSPPAYLIDAVRYADSEGQTVSAKVELKTGDRSIATLLLKRS